MTIDWPIALRDGALLAVATSMLVMGTLRANPRLLMRHFPAELRVAVPPVTPRDQPVGKLVGAETVPFRFNHLQHARGFAVGSVLSAVIAGLVSWGVTR